MNGIHDMGGMQDFGAVPRERDEPVFHHEWERRLFAMTVACGYCGKWNLDMTRYARERMPPAAYLEASYYQRWLWAFALQLREAGLLSEAELAERLRAAREPRPAEGPPPGTRVLRAADVEKVLRDPRGAQMDTPVTPSFKPGDRVRARTINPVGHTRLPRYVRGHVGVVEQDQGVWIFPDTHAAGEGKKPQHVYSVRFAARELWGAAAPARDYVYVDLWDDYLDAA